MNINCIKPVNSSNGYNILLALMILNSICFAQKARHGTNWSRIGKRMETEPNNSEKWDELYKLLSNKHKLITLEDSYMDDNDKIESGEIILYSYKCLFFKK